MSDFPEYAQSAGPAPPCARHWVSEAAMASRTGWEHELHLQGNGKEELWEKQIDTSINTPQKELPQGHRHILQWFGTCNFLAM